MTETKTTGAWGVGLATYAGEKVLDAWFPEPHLELEGAPAHPGTREVQGALAGDLVSAARGDDLRGVRVIVIATVIADLREPPAARSPSTAWTSSRGWSTTSSPPACGSPTPTASGSAPTWPTARR